MNYAIPQLMCIWREHTRNRKLKFQGCVVNVLNTEGRRRTTKIACSKRKYYSAVIIIIEMSATKLWAVSFVKLSVNGSEQFFCFLFEADLLRHNSWTDIGGFYAALTRKQVALWIYSVDWILFLALGGKLDCLWEHKKNDEEAKNDCLSYKVIGLWNRSGE